MISSDSTFIFSLPAYGKARGIELDGDVIETKKRCRVMANERRCCCHCQNPQSPLHKHKVIKFGGNGLKRLLKYL